MQHGVINNTVNRYSKECVFRAFMVMVVYQLEVGCHVEFQLHQ